MAAADRPFRTTIGGCQLVRESLVAEGCDLSLRFRSSGPGASIRFPKDHVAAFPDGATEKLTSLGGYGREDDGGGPGTSFSGCLNHHRSPRPA